jgi:hypothetical protein
MKKLILLIIAGSAAVVAIGLQATPHPKKQTPVIHKSYTRTQVTYGIEKPYLNCTPKKDFTASEQRLNQQELLHTEREMARYNNTNDNTNNADLQDLNDIYQQQVAEYDDCSMTN